MNSDGLRSGLTVLLTAVTVFSAFGCASPPVVRLDVAGHEITVEIADTPESRAQGLMNRDSMAENHGMLFVFDKEDRVSFWMKNTKLPLSIAFIAADGRIRQIEPMEPYSLAPVQSSRNVLYALEMNQGWFAERGITPGALVVIPPFGE